MSYCREDGKDKLIFVTKEDSNADCKVELSEDEEQPGLITSQGEINWECPCLGGMATGPCGVEFREAFSCFYYSKEEPKGSECYETFHKMTECMSEYPTVYGGDKDITEEIAENLAAEEAAAEESDDELVPKEKVTKDKN